MLKRTAVRFIGEVVDLGGGVPVRTPGGERVKVAFEARHLYRDYEPAVIAAFLAEIKPHMTVFDIGAHWGAFTLIAAHRARSVVAFEPSTQNRALLQRNVELSGFQNVKVRGEALSDAVGTVTFHEYQGPSWGMSMMGGLVGHEFTKPVEVPTITIDALDVAPSFIKMDIEGAEALAVEGATNTLAKVRPLLLIEVHHRRLEALGKSAEGVRDQLTGLGYSIERIRGDKPPTFQEEVDHWMCRPSGAARSNE